MKKKIIYSHIRRPDQRPVYVTTKAENALYKAIAFWCIRYATRLEKPQKSNRIPPGCWLMNATATDNTVLQSDVGNVHNREMKWQEIIKIIYYVTRDTLF